MLLESSVLNSSGSRIEANHQSIYSPQQIWGDREFDLLDAIFFDGQEDW